MSAGRENWTHEQFKADGTDEFISILLVLNQLEVRMEVYIIVCILSTFRLSTSPSPDLKLIFPSVYAPSFSFSPPLTLKANLFIIIGILLLTNDLYDTFLILAICLVLCPLSPQTKPGRLTSACNIISNSFFLDAVNLYIPMLT